MTPLTLYEIAPGQVPREIPIATGSDGDFPLTIGRDSHADIQIGVIGWKILVPHPDPRERANGERVPISSLISRTQATIFRDESGKLRIRDGNSHPSGSGIREGRTNKLIRRPWLLGPGAHIKLTPEGGGYRCWLEWPAEKSESETPTLGFDQWQNENLNEELAEQRAALKALQEELITAKNESREIDTKQNQRILSAEKKISRLLLLGAIAVGVFAVSLGISTEQIQTIVQVIAIVSAIGGGGFILQNEKP
ncbi:FHA domain-containing protein [Leptothoe sp. ISB3NOV94-8A]